MTSLQKTISKIYWRNIKKGSVAFNDIEDEIVAAEVKRLASLDVASGIISAEQFAALIGK